jgi:hypothetical protein
MMIKLAAAAALLFGSTVAQCRCHSQASYVYDEMGTSLSYVFWLSDNTIAVRNKNHIKSRSGDIGGGFEVCSDALRYCLAGPINILIPKSFELRRLRNEKTTCLVNRQRSGLVGTCRDIAGGKSVSYEYTKLGGIRSFVIKTDVSSGLYAVRGGCGLFSVR